MQPEYLQKVNKDLVNKSSSLKLMKCIQVLPKLHSSTLSLSLLLCIYF